MKQSVDRMLGRQGGKLTKRPGTKTSAPISFIGRLLFEEKEREILQVYLQN